MGLDPLRLGFEHGREGVDPDPGRQSPGRGGAAGGGRGAGGAGTPRRCEPSVHEHQGDRTIEPGDALPGEPPHHTRAHTGCRAVAGRTLTGHGSIRRAQAERPPLDRAHAGVLPVFIALRGEASFAEPIERVAPRPLHPAHAGARQRSVHLAPLPAIVLDGRGGGRGYGHQPAASRR